MNKGTEVQKQRFVSGVFGALMGVRLRRGSETRPAQELQGSGVPVVVNTADWAPLGLFSSHLCEALEYLYVQDPTGLVILLT